MMNMPSERQPRPDYLEDIPFLSSISPAIFVPTDRDFTQPLPPSSDDPEARLRENLMELDRHSMLVEENMVWMFAREAERIRRAGAVERVHYDEYKRPVSEDQTGKAPILALEEKILQEDERTVLRLLADEKYRDYRDAGRSREEPRERWQRHAPVPPPPPPPPQQRPAGPREFADLATMRSEMVKVDVDELRLSPRQAALTHILNLVKWAWDEQLEGHRAAVNKEKEERWAEYHRQTRAKPSPLATTGPSASISPTTTAAPSASSRTITWKGGDAMDLD
ncbi:hypothetical protein F5Y17DRAFT_343834 [Xylariaceae sp. FL0594]|nr:hypothetical protein F5Y17DRAFT_343834 [Xylariaceae sp. FL0594]